MRNPAKFDRCVSAVEARGGAVNPYAVCTSAGLAALGEEYAPRLVRSTPLDRALEAVPLWTGSDRQKQLAEFGAMQTLWSPNLSAPGAPGDFLERWKWPLAGALVLAVLLLKGRR